VDITRRQFVATAGSAVASIALGNCVGSAQSRAGHDGRLTARLRTGVTTSLKSGPLGLGGSGRDGVIQMPSVIPSGPMPLLVFLHGATQSGARTITRVSAAAEQLGIAVVAPDSRNGTWDAIRDEFDEDVVFLNKALEHVFERVNVDPARLAIGGFSDGASYGLSLGLVNGDLFPRVVACSPGFIIQAPSNGRPHLFFSHGTSDQVLPIDQCSRVMVPRLRSMGYDVTFKEFDGRHELPPEIAMEALRWMTG
jgi:phospholipase/carboxylesterase